MDINELTWEDVEMIERLADEAYSEESRDRKWKPVKEFYSAVLEKFLRIKSLGKK